MEIKRVVNSVFCSCSYVLSQDHTTWLVDCGDVDQLLPLIDGELRGVLLTHGHFDHIYGLNLLLTQFPGAFIVTNIKGKEALMCDKLNFSKYHGDPFVLDFPDSVRLVNDGDHIELFEGVQAQAVFTPGHSPGCVTWLVDNAVFTGDSLIPDVKTVTNLPHSDKAQALESEELIRQLALCRDIYPGHATDYKYEI